MPSLRPLFWRDCLFTLAAAIPTLLLLLIWQSKVPFWAGADDAEYWLASGHYLDLLRERGLSVVPEIFLSVSQYYRPNIQPFIGVPILAITGKNILLANRIFGIFFFPFFAAGTYKILFTLTRRPWFALLFTQLIVTNPFYFVTAQAFLSELPFLCAIALAIYFHLRGLTKSFAACAALAISIRALEGLSLFLGWQGLRGIYLWRVGKVKGIEVALPGLYLAGAAYFLFATFNPNIYFLWHYFWPSAGIALYFLASRMLKKTFSYADSLLLPVGLAGIWLAPHLLNVVHWARIVGRADADGYAPAVAKENFFQFSLREISLFLGWQGLALAALGMFFLFSKRRRSHLPGVLGGIFLVLAATLGIFQLGNALERDLFGRYLLGYFFLFLLPLFALLADTGTRRERCAVACISSLALGMQLLVFLDAYLPLRLPADKLGAWYQASFYALSSPGREHWGKSLFDALPLEDVPSRLRFALVNDGSQAAYTELDFRLRSMERSKDWRLVEEVSEADYWIVAREVNRPVPFPGTKFIADFSLERNQQKKTYALLKASARNPR
ncbi:MAG: hypothetical protein AB7K68_14025 [Bacteriovoracia bacterium]